MVAMEDQGGMMFCILDALCEPHHTGVGTLLAAYEPMPGGISALLDASDSMPLICAAHDEIRRESLWKGRYIPKEPSGDHDDEPPSPRPQLATHSPAPPPSMSPVRRSQPPAPTPTPPAPTAPTPTPAPTSHTSAAPAPVASGAGHAAASAVRAADRTVRPKEYPRKDDPTVPHPLEPTPPKTVPTAVRPARPTLSKTVQKEYIKKHNIHTLLGEAIDACLHDMPQDPFVHIATTLLASRSNRIEPASVNKRVLSSGSRISELEKEVASLKQALTQVWAEQELEREIVGLRQQLLHRSSLS